jgi:hypothetical protein
MRVVEPRDGGKEQLGELGAIGLADIFEDPLIALAHDLLRLVRRFLVQDLGEELELEALAPEIIGGGGVFGPRRL